jgi:cytochrome c peroxidase
VHAEDSVLAKYRAADGIGLKQTYAQLVKKAFNAKYWSAKAPKGGKAPFGKPAYSDEAYTQMEANFSMFFGLAMQEYFNTLIADQAPIDSKRVQICFDGTSIQPVSTCPSNDQLIEAPQELSAAQLRGMQNFINAHCVLCHSGALFSAAESPENLTVTRNKKGKAKLQAPDPNTINTVLRTTDLTGRPRLQDVGFMNTGVAHWSFDQGLGRDSALHPEMHQPLSFARQYLSELIGDSSGVLDPLKAKACRLGVAFAGGRSDPMAFPKDQLQADPAGSDGCVVTDYHNGSVTDKTSLAFIPTQEAAQAEWNKTLRGEPSLLKVGVSAAFKIPSLRNVELTAPYFHNGSVLTLRQVFEFYSRTGNYTNPDRAAGEMPTLSEIIGESSTAIDDLVEFLKSLTDERVRNEAAPFDHPALKVPYGHKGDEAVALDEDGDGLADDEILEVPAIGKNGRSAQGLEPIKPLQQTIEGGDGTL